MVDGGYIYHRLVVGYHGCDRKVAERVLLDHEPLAPSDNRYDWLGRGVYFWEHGYKRALEFAEWKQSRGEISEPTVLGAYIHLGRCFDLTDTMATRLLRAYYDELEARHEVQGVPMPENRQAAEGDHDLVLRELDCAVLNLAFDRLERRGQAVQTARGVFVEGGQAYPGARIHLQTHVQIAVRDPSCILGYFLPVRRYT